MPLKCNICRQPWTKPRGYRMKSLCPACRVATLTARIAHGDTRYAPPLFSPAHERRVQFYTAIVAAGGRLFE